MSKISETQLLINERGAVYHLDLRSEELADDVILVGDPNRVEMISRHFDRIDTRRANRELITHTGEISGRRITVLSTGMGVDNIDIVLNELDAVANIDFSTREIRSTHRSLNIIRLGTTGALVPYIEPGDTVISRYAIGLDGIAYFYRDAEKIINKPMTDAFIKHTNWSEQLPRIYAVKADEEIFNRINRPSYHDGITITSPGFYGPQGRNVRAILAYPELNQKIESFKFYDFHATNFEMESSALFFFAKLLGHKATTVCTVPANRVTEKACTDYHPFVEKLIKEVLEKLVG